MQEHEQLLEELIGEPITSTRELAEGQVGLVLQVTTASGRALVAKFSAADNEDLLLEARMLDDLTAHDDFPSLPILARSPRCLIMEHIPTYQGRESHAAEEHAARALANLHDHTAPRYGYDYDNLIGGLPQRNTWEDDWSTFFAKHRLLAMGQMCLEHEAISADTMRRLREVIERLDDLIPEPNKPGLIHGDIWGGNVLWGEDRVAAFIDPAIYYADPEIEIAFSTMFQTFSPHFYEAYNELRPLSSDFWEVRRPLYNLYPLLVHVRIYAGGYIAELEQTLDRFL